MNHRTRQRGITAIKLIIIVLLVLILAVIAIPNFLEAPRPPYVAKAKAEMQTLAVALENYFEEKKAYPPPDPGNRVPAVLSRLSYIYSLPTDDFSNQKPRTTYRYYISSVTPAWIMVSNGPDRDVDINGYPDGAETVLPVLQPRQYDPTNGTVSDGDVFRTGP